MAETVASGVYKADFVAVVIDSGFVAVSRVKVLAERYRAKIDEALGTPPKER